VFILFAILLHILHTSMEHTAGNVYEKGQILKILGHVDALISVSTFHLSCIFNFLPCSFIHSAQCLLTKSTSFFFNIPAYIAKQPVNIVL